MMYSLQCKAHIRFHNADLYASSFHKTEKHTLHLDAF